MQQETENLHFPRGPLKYRLMNDYMFKAFLQRNKKALKGLLCALLGLREQDIKSGFLEKFFSKYQLYCQNTKHVYSDKLTLLMLQLNQSGDSEDEKQMPELCEWAQLFRAVTWEEIAMLAEKNESIKEGIVTLKKLSDDEKIRMQCEARERYHRDMAAATSMGVERGMEKGIEKGIDIGSKKVIRLSGILLEAGRVEDLRRMLSDNDFRDGLFREYNL